MNMLKGGTIKLVGLLLVAVAMSAYGVSDKERVAIEERIQPAGKSCMEGDNSCGAAVASSGGAKSPEDIYNTNCMACHATGAAGAPKMGDTAAWSGRLAQGMDQLYANAINGFNGMPAKGLCMSCSDDEVKAVVDYIVESSK
ncbi:cytochrome c5 family protein [Oceanicoccus sp. KOV_DT_Chl]|uniref:c-type cytochrome n=1 Tax=Oceanicoccus sp. KOV_DT_Chl TaxID=1904639 RepID=UPI000C799629|nr:c-type cytochrome [Oceanicoccus sp. KOV_DT_Chl]